MIKISKQNETTTASRKIWWLEVLIPLLLSFALFSSFTYLIYSGEQHRKIASKLEKKLFEISIMNSSFREIKNKNQIVTINLMKSDLIYFNNKLKTNFSTDISIELYSELIRKAVNSGSKYIILSWNPSNHLEESYTTLLTTLDSIPNDVTVIFSTPYELLKRIPEDAQKKLTIVDSEPCQSEIQYFCSYNIKWDDWIIQKITHDFWKEKPNKSISQLISSNLPSSFPSFILHLNNEHEFSSFSFKDILSQERTDGLKNKFIFIGSKLNTNTVEKFNTVQTSLNIKVEENYPKITSYHIFWAQVAQMFIDNDLITIVHAFYSNVFALVFAFFIILMFVFFGAPASLGTFLIFCVSAPFLNAFSIKYFNIYLPVFNTVFAGVSAFLFIAFGRLSINAVHHWRLTAKQDIETETADLKGNFISLISHNLNTPVAKMQGMLDLLSQLSKDDELKKDIKSANKYVAKIQLSIKSVLVTTAVNEKTINHDSLNLSHIKNEYIATMKPTIKRLGLETDLTFDEADDFSMIPLKFDKRAISALLGCISGLSIIELNSPTFIFKLKVDECSDDELKLGSERLRIEVDKTLFDSPNIIAELKGEHHTYNQDNNNHTVEKDVFIKLINSVLSYYNGRFFDSEDKKTIGFVLYPAKT